MKNIIILFAMIIGYNFLIMPEKKVEVNKADRQIKSIELNKSDRVKQARLELNKMILEHKIK